MIDWYIIAVWAYVIWIFFNSVVMHEAGHIFYLLFIARGSATVSYNKGRIEVTYNEFENKLHSLGIKMSGVLMGFLPIWIYTGGGQYFGIFVFLYLIGSRRDIWLTIKEGLSL